MLLQDGDDKDRKPGADEASKAETQQPTVEPSTLLLQLDQKGEQAQQAQQASELPQQAQQAQQGSASPQQSQQPVGQSDHAKQTVDVPQQAQQSISSAQQAHQEPVPVQYAQQAPELHGLAGELPKRPILGVSEDLSGGALVRKVSIRPHLQQLCSLDA